MKSVMASRASGAKVSLISAYSAGSPVVQCCIMWLRPGRMRVRAAGMQRRMAAMFDAASTCRSLSPGVCHFRQKK